MSHLKEKLDARQYRTYRRSSRQSIGGESLKPRIENNVLHSPYPDIDVPVCSVYKAVKGFLSVESGSRAAVEDSKRSLTRPELLKMMERYAAGFQKLGIKPGVHVCVHLHNNVECMAVIFGVIFAGGTVILSNVAHKHQELLYRMRDGEATYVVTDLKNADKVRGVCDELRLTEKNRLAVSETPGFTSIAGFEALDEKSFVEPLISDPRNAIAALIYTSGTTGSPKGVEVTHYSFVANLYQNKSILIPEDPAVFLASSPLTHLSGFLFTLLLACNGFACVITSPTLTFQRFLDVCEKYKVSWMMGFPTRLQYLMRRMMLMDVRICSLRTLLLGGSVVTEEVNRMARSVFPGLRDCRIFYSLTECGGLLTASRQTNVSSVDLGFPTPNVELKFLNTKTREPVGPMEHGEIAFRSPSTMRGYYKRPEETAKILDSEGWCLTGDLAYYDRSGRVYYVERLKELIKSMDDQVVPGEVEEVIRQKCPEVGEVSVVGLPHPDYGEMPTAFVVLTEEGKGKVTEDDIKKAVADNLAAYKRIGAVYFCDFLPHSETGKVRRSALRDDERFRRVGGGGSGAVTPDAHPTSGIATPDDESTPITRGLPPVKTPSTQSVH